jgi:hypothetical protein
MAAKAEETIAGLREDQLQWKPPDGRWSIAQCLDHLNRANGKILTQLEPGIERAKSQGSQSSAPWKPGFMERMFIRAVTPNPPLGFKSPVPPDFLPEDEPDVAQLMPTFRAQHDRFVAGVDTVEKHGLVHIKIPSPVSKLIKCQLGTWFAATAEHDLYHLGQAASVRKELDAFAASSQ